MVEAIRNLGIRTTTRPHGQEDVVAAAEQNHGVTTSHHLTAEESPTTTEEATIMAASLLMIEESIGTTIDMLAGIMAEEVEAMAGSTMTIVAAVWPTMSVIEEIGAGHNPMEALVEVQLEVLLQIGTPLSWVIWQAFESIVVT